MSKIALNFDVQLIIMERTKSPHRFEAFACCLRKVYQEPGKNVDDSREVASADVETST